VSGPGQWMQRMGQLEQALRDAEATRTEYANKRDDKPKEVSRKKAEKAAEAERVGAGGDPDPKLEQKLLRELRELESGLDARNVSYPQAAAGGGPAVPDFRTELYDPDAEAAWRGADDAVKECENDLRQFAAENMARVAAELEPKALEIQRRVTTLLRDARQLRQEESGLQGVFVRLFTLSGREALIGTSPPSPLDFLDAADVPREVRMPMPECFTRQQ
jgi:hypothetical protein